MPMATRNAAPLDLTKNLIVFVVDSNQLEGIGRNQLEAINSFDLLEKVIFDMNVEGWEVCILYNCKFISMKL